MGLLVDGVWHDKWYDTKKSGGSFERSSAGFRNWITPDGAPGPTGTGGFAAQSGRYHLYVSYACPWAHRTLIFRQIKGLSDHIRVSAVHPDMLSDGWTFETDADGATGDTLYGLPFARDIYTKADPTCSGRVTVPILWDTEQETIVSNESSEIIRMFNSAFDDITGNSDDYWPEHLRDAIAPVNDRIYDTLNNGVYKCGFATTQSAYDTAVEPLFETLDWLETAFAHAPLSDGGPIDRSRLAVVHHPDPVRSCLSPAFQMQPQPHRRLSGTVGLCAGTVPVAGCWKDGKFFPHRAPLSLQPRNHQSAPDHSDQSRSGL